MSLQNLISPLQNLPANLNPGEKVLEWKAFDYHPHKRGIVWMIVFSLVILGGAVWAILEDPKWGWTTAVTIFLAASFYFWIHREGDKIHNIQLYEKGFLIDQQFLTLEKIAGFWLVFDNTASILKIELKGKTPQTLSLQMGQNDPDFFRIPLNQLGVLELEDRKESLTELWIRALKL